QPLTGPQTARQASVLTQAFCCLSFARGRHDSSGRRRIDDVLDCPHVHRHPSVLGAAAGAVAGFAAITPASDYVNVSASHIIGFGAGAMCIFAVNLIRERDALDVFGVHGVGATWAAIATVSSPPLLSTPPPPTV